MKDPKKPDHKKNLGAAPHDDIRDLFATAEGLDTSPEDEEDEDVLELDEVVDDGEDGLKDLPDLDDALPDLENLDVDEPLLDETDIEESLFDDEEMTVELAPSGKGTAPLRKPLEEDVPAEEPVEPDETLLAKEENAVTDALEEESWPEEELDNEAPESEEEQEAVEDLAEPQPVETELWDIDKELEEALKTIEAEGEAASDLDGAAQESGSDTGTALPVEPDVLSRGPSEDEPPKPQKAQKEPTADQGLSREELTVHAAAAAGTAIAAGMAREMDNRGFTMLTESAEEIAMEERPAMFQPIVEILEKKLQVMVHKAVQEQLPVIVRRVLQEEIERLSKSLG